MSKITEDFRSAALRRGLLVKPAKGSANSGIAYAGAIELANLGFVVDPKELVNVGVETITETIRLARKIMGADRDMTPIYPGFPQQVQELSTMTLLVEQILHYFSGGKLLPNYPTIAREGLALEDMLRNARSLKVVKASDAAKEIVTSLVTNPVAISDDDKALLKGALELQKPDAKFIAKTVKDARNGENIQSFITAVKDVSSFSNSELVLIVLPVIFNNDTLLRVLLTLFTTVAKVTSAHAAPQRAKNYDTAVNHLADRNVRSVRMLNIPRPVRRAILAKTGLISDGFKADTVVARRGLWRKVMTAVHPYDFTLNTAEKRVMDIIHSNVDYRTLNSIIEEAMAKGDVITAVDMLATHQSGNLLRRLVALLRLADTTKKAKHLAKAVAKVGDKATLSTLISSYNGVIAANDDATRVTRVAGLNNTMVSRDNVVKVNEEHLTLVVKGIKKAIKAKLATKPAPVGVVPVKSTVAVPLVRRDASTSDREMARGEEIALAGSGDTLRIFTHWNNNQSVSGYMDAGFVILDDKFNNLAVITWNSWSSHRAIGTYSGDKHVMPGDSAAEYFDLDLSKVKAKYPTAIYVAMTIQSYSGFPTSKVDIIAGAMLRSAPNSGEVFDARNVVTAFKPTTDSTQAVPLAVDLRSGKMLWVDSSNGSDSVGVSSTGDNSIGSIIYDELERPRLTLGQLAKLWAKAHGAETSNKPVDKDALLKLL